MRRGLWLIPLLAFSFLATLPFPAHALCPSSCTNNATGENSHRSFGSSDTFTVTGLNVNDFLVTVVTCESGVTITAVSGTGDNGWTKDTQSSDGSGSAGLPQVTAVWHSKATATSDAMTYTYSSSAANGCGEYMIGFDTLATIYGGAIDQTTVYTCTGGSPVNNPCGTNSQAITNSITVLGSSVLIIQAVGVNSSGTSMFSSSGGTGAVGFSATGPSSTLIVHYPNCSPLTDNQGSDCLGQLVWAWQSAVTNYVGGITFDAGNPSGAANGNICNRGSGAKCYVQIQTVTAVYSNQNQAGQTSIAACAFSQLQCWWYPLFFMGLYAGFVLMVGTWLQTSPRGKSHLFLSAVTFGSLIAVIFGIMTIAFPLMMLVLNTIIALRLRA